MKLVICFASSVAGASLECLAGDAACNAGEFDDIALLSLRAPVKRHAIEEAAPTSATATSVCSGASEDNLCWKYYSKAFLIDPDAKDASSCGVIGKGKGTDAMLCDTPNWVYCRNAKCSEEVKQDPDSGAWYSECACWQQTSDNGKARQNLSIIPEDSTQGANCVMGKQPGGKEMCDQMKAGKLHSSFGPEGSFLPGLPLASASCEPHTPWLWCWGAPCERNEAGDVVCKCPLMISMNDVPQEHSLPGESLCTENPCSHLLNSSPAGSNTTPLGLNADWCYDYRNASTAAPPTPGGAQ